MGGGTILVGTCPCNNPALQKNVGDTLGTDEDVCVRLSMAGSYTFTYDVSGVSDCCNPCTSTVVITLTEGDLTMVGGGSQCSDTFAIHSGSASALCCSSNIAIDAGVRVDNCQGSGTPTYVSSTVPINVYSGWDINLSGNECFEIYAMGLTVMTCDGEKQEQQVVVGGQGEGMDGVCVNTFTNITNCLGTCTYVDLGQYYKCVIETAISMTSDITDILGTPAVNGMHYDLEVIGNESVTPATVSIKFKVKHFTGTCCEAGVPCTGEAWIVPKTSAIKDTLVHYNNGTNCGVSSAYSNTTDASLDVSDAVVPLTFNPVVGFCNVYNINVTFNNIVSTTSSTYNTIVTNPYTIWNLLSFATTPPNKFTNVGGNTWVNTCGKFTLYANSTTCIGVGEIEWNNPGTSGSNFSTTGEGKVFAVDNGGAPLCISTKINCGCTKCAHICITESPLTITQWLPGDCTCGCTQNPGCTTCT